MASNSQPTNPSLIYWDSCTYLDYLKGSGNHPLFDAMRDIIEDWEAGKVTMVTSALTIVEVLFVNCIVGGQAVRLDPLQDPYLRPLFDPPADRKFIIVEVSRTVAMKARDIFWNHGIRPKDSIHVASAVQARCEVMHTNDLALHSRTRQVGGTPVLRIEAPSWTKQMPLPNPSP